MTDNPSHLGNYLTADTQQQNTGTTRVIDAGALSPFEAPHVPTDESAKPDEDAR